MARVTLDLDNSGKPIKINLYCDITENSLAKSIPGYYFSKLKSAWTYPFSLSTFEEIQMKFPESADEKTLAMVQKIYEANKAIEDIKKMDDVELKSVLSQFLMNYQRIAVKLMKEIPNPLLADDMGVGKTLESICLCEEINEGASCDDLAILVVCPNTLKWTWAEEIEHWKRMAGTWADGCVQVIDGTPKKKEKLWQKPGKYTIINYEALPTAPQVYFTDVADLERRIEKRNAKRMAAGLPPKPKGKRIWEEDVPDRTWDVLIIDEAHRIKNRKSMYTQAVGAIRAKKIIAVTGTPFMNQVDELWSILHRLDPVKYSSYWTFVDKFCEVVETPFGKKITGAKSMDALKKELAPIMIRRMKEEIIADLPDKSYQRILVEMTPVQKKLYNEMKNNLVACYMKPIMNVQPDDIVEQIRQKRLAEKNVIHFSPEDNVLDAKLFIEQLKKLGEPFMEYDIADYDIAKYAPSNEEDPKGKKAVYNCVVGMLEDFRDRSERVAIVTAPTEPFKTAMENVGNLSASTLLAQTTRLRQIAISAGLLMNDKNADAPKLDTLCDILPEYLVDGKKAVIMSQFAAALDMLKPRLDAMGLKYVEITGAIPIPERQAIVNQFQNDDSIKLFLGTIRAAGVGITLTRASTIFFLDREWNPAINDQAEDRLHRTGQKNNVLVVDLIAKNTVESYVWKLLRKKQDLFDEVINVREVIEALKSTDA